MKANSRKKIIFAIPLLFVMLVFLLFFFRQKYTQPTPFGFDANSCKCKGLKLGGYCYGKVYDCIRAESIPN